MDEHELRYRATAGMPVDVHTVRVRFGSGREGQGVAVFEFDEDAVNEQFGHRLDAMLPSVARRHDSFPVSRWPVLLWLSCLARLQPFRVESTEGGMKALFDNRLTGDADKLVIRMALDALVLWVMKWRLEVGRPLTVWPLEFEYNEGIFIVGSEARSGTEVVFTTTVEWAALG